MRELTVITPYWPTEMNPDRGNFVYNQCNELSKRGYKIKVLYFERHGFFKSLRRGDIVEPTNSGILVKRIKYRSVINGSLLDCLIVFSIFLVCRSKIAYGNLIFTHTILPFIFINCFLSRRRKVILWLHGSDYRVLYRNSRVRSIYDRLMNGMNINVVVPTESFFDSVEQTFIAPVYHIPSIINYENVLPDVTAAEMGKDFDFIFIGNNNYVKGADLFLEAIEKLVAIYPSITAVVVGEGYEKVQRSEHLVFTGRVHWDQLSRLLEKSRVLVNCSRQEALGQVVIEGMAHGLPCVVTRSGGPEAITYDADLIADFTPLGLCLKMSLALKKLTQEDLSSERRAHALGLCSSEIVCDKIEGVIK